MSAESRDRRLRSATAPKIVGGSPVGYGFAAISDCKTHRFGEYPLYMVAPGDLIPVKMF